MRWVGIALIGLLMGQFDRPGGFNTSVPLTLGDKITVGNNSANKLVIAGSAATVAPTITASGSDINVGINFVNKGTGAGSGYSFTTTNASNGICLDGTTCNITLFNNGGTIQTSGGSNGISTQGSITTATINVSGFFVHTGGNTWQGNTNVTDG